MTVTSGLSGKIYGQQAQQASTPQHQQDEGEKTSETTPEPTKATDQQDAPPQDPPSSDDREKASNPFTEMSRSGRYRAPEFTPESEYPLTGLRAMRYRAAIEKLKGEGKPASEASKDLLVLNDVDKRAWAQKHTNAHSAYVKQRIDLNVDRIRTNIGSGLQPIISLINTKSGSKTINALHLAAIIGYYTGKFVLVFPATPSTDTSTLGLMSGIQGKHWLSVSEFNQKVPVFDEYKRFSKEIRRNDEFRFGVVTEDDGDSPDDYDAWHFVLNMLRILPYVDVLILDHGNDNLQLNSFGYAAARLSHALEFVSKYGDPFTENTMRRSMLRLDNDREPWEFDPAKINELYAQGDRAPAGFTPRSIERLFEDTGYLLPTPDKVRSSTLVSSIYEGDESIDFSTLTLPGPDAQDDRTLSQPWRGEGFTVHKDDYLAQMRRTPGQRNKVQPVNLWAIKPPTFLDFTDIAADVLDNAAAASKKVQDKAPEFSDLWKNPGTDNGLPSSVSPNPFSEGDLK